MTRSRPWRLSGLGVLGLLGLLACDSGEGRERAPAPSPTTPTTAAAPAPTPSPTAPTPSPTAPTPTTDDAPSLVAGELAYLAAASAQDRILADARTEAADCDAGQADACRRLANRYEEGIGAPRDPARALALYRRGCEQGLGFHCLLGGWLQTATRDPDALAEGLALLRRACALGQPFACSQAAVVLERAELPGGESRPGELPGGESRPGELPGGESRPGQALRAKACAGGYRFECRFDEAAAVPEPAASSAEAACPVAFYWTSSQSGGPRLHPTLVQLDHGAMLAALPETLGAWTSERRSSTPAGWAGTRTSSASVTLVAGERRLGIAVVDRAPDCTLQRGTGAVMVAHASRTGARPTALGEWPALVMSGADAEAPEILTAWIADRCTLSIDGLQADVAEIAASLDLTAIAQLCAQRPTPGPAAPG